MTNSGVKRYLCPPVGAQDGTTTEDGAYDLSLGAATRRVTLQPPAMQTNDEMVR